MYIVWYVWCGFALSTKAGLYVKASDRMTPHGTSSLILMVMALATGSKRGRGLHLRRHTARDRQALLGRTASYPSLQHRQESAGDGANTCGRELSLAMNSAMNAAMSGRWQCNTHRLPTLR